MLKKNTLESNLQNFLNVFFYSFFYLVLSIKTSNWPGASCVQVTLTLKVDEDVPEFRTAAGLGYTHRCEFEIVGSGTTLFIARSPIGRALRWFPTVIRLTKINK